jgi:hypothetical protein
MKTEFDFSVEGFDLFKSGIKKYKSGKIIQLVSVAGLLLSPAFVRNPDRETVLGIIGGSFIISAVGLHINLSGRKQIQKAVWIRNRDVLFPIN